VRLAHSTFSRLRRRHWSAKELFSVLQIKLTREEAVNSAWNVSGCARVARRGTFVMNLLGGRRKEFTNNRGHSFTSLQTHQLTKTRLLRGIHKNNVDGRATCMRGGETRSGVSASNS